MIAAWSPQQIARLPGIRLLQGPGQLPIWHYAYDSRKLPARPGHTLFLALAGPSRDGHAYVQAAYAAGVRMFWLSHPVALPPDASVLQSASVLQGLQLLAAHHRAQFRIPVIGITGSNGKTIVKEWLGSLLAGWQLAKSPRSYNSQLGVALSLLALRPHHQLAIIEAGISQVGEMQRLADMIRPSWGVFTGLGDAHDEGFADRTEKLAEKLKLFATCERVYAPEAWAEQIDRPLVRLGSSPAADAQLLAATPQAEGWALALRYRQQQHRLYLPVSAPHAPQNLLAAWAVAYDLGVAPGLLQEHVRLLRPVQMRMEMLTDNPELTILSDAYNADASSVSQAFQWLAQDRSQPGKHLILTDLEHQGQQQRAVQARLLQEAQALFGSEITLIGPVFQALAPPHIPAYAEVDALLEHWDYSRYVGKTVLLKGARLFRLERLIPYLSQRPSQTELQINLGAIAHNLRVLRRQLPAGTGLLAMVKASAYGSGSWEVAHLLEEQGVDALGVAYLQEGIALRKKGVQAPILVFNSLDAAADQLRAYRLEPVVGSLAELEKRLQQHLPLHLELDTGMGRMGLLPAEVPAALQLLAATPGALHSVFTHLAAAEDPAQDALTHRQLAQFEAELARIRALAPAVKAHVLNSAGLLRFATHAHDWVRLGLALYGIPPADACPWPLQQAASLYTHIIRLATYPAGQGLSYGHRFVTQRPSRIATLPLGYADGIPRAMQGAMVEVLGTRCPIVGAICMDLMLVDVTEVPAAQVGSPVLIFGPSLPLTQQAAAAGTIAYELIAGMSPRVRRWFYRE
jgi:alanine racemase